MSMVGTTKSSKAAKRTAAQGNIPSTLPAAMTGRASPAKAAVGDKPVFAYSLGERIGLG
jgi:hypothetical protein